MKKTFLITGAGTGIGRAIAINLTQKHPDATLVLTGRNLKNLNETLALCENPKHIVLPLDLTKIESIQNLKQQLVDRSMTLDSLILNAGIGGENHYGKEDRWNEILATNLTGPYLMIQELLPLLRMGKSEYKNIVLISSILARLGVPKYSAYCASKAGLLGLMRSTAAELAPEKILVNAICPGWVDTEMSVQGLDAMAKASGLSYEQVRQQQMSFVPLRKMSEPSEVAELVNFLVNGFQTSLTGQTLDFNNGALMP